MYTGGLMCILHRCNILTCTTFHHPTHGNVNTCSIPVCPLGYEVHIKLCTLQLRSIHKQVFHFCRSTSLMCTGNRWHIRMLHQFWGKTQNIFLSISVGPLDCVNYAYLIQVLPTAVFPPVLFTYQTIRPN